MPEIPRYTSRAPYPGVKVSPGISALPYQALVESGEQIKRTGIYQTEVYGDIADKEALAATSVKAAELTANMDNEFNILAGELKERKDFENFPDLIYKRTEEIRHKLQPQLFGYSWETKYDRMLSDVFAKTFPKYVNNISSVSREKGIQVRAERGRAAAINIQNNRLNDYVIDPNPATRKITAEFFGLEMDLMASQGAIGIDDAAKLKVEFNTKGDRDRAKREIEIDPRSGLSSIYDKDKFPHLTASDQDTLSVYAHNVMRQQDSDRRQAVADAEKALTQRRDILQTNIDWAIFKGGDAAELLDEGVKIGVADSKIIHDFVTFSKTIADAKASEAPEDPDVRAKLILGTYGNKITVSEEDLRNAVGNGINTKTFETLLGHVTSRKESDRKEAKSDFEKARDSAFEHYEKSMGMKFQVTGPAAAIIDREANSLHADALVEYRGLVYDKKNPLTPSDAFEKIMPRYEQAMDNIKRRNSTKLRKSLVIPNNDLMSVDEMAIWLDKNKKNIPQATFNAQINMLRQIEWLETTQEEEKAKRLQQQQGGK